MARVPGPGYGKNDRDSLHLERCEAVALCSKRAPDLYVAPAIVPGPRRADSRDCAGDESLRHKTRDSPEPSRVAERNDADGKFEARLAPASHHGPRDLRLGLSIETFFRRRESREEQGRHRPKQRQPK